MDRLPHGVFSILSWFLLVDCLNEPSLTVKPLREEGQVELFGETPNGLSARASLPKIPTLCQQKNNVGRHPTFRRVRFLFCSPHRNAKVIQNARNDFMKTIMIIFGCAVTAILLQTRK